MTVMCPGCGQRRNLGREVHVGAVVTCASCAGALFRLEQQAGEYVLREVPQASCPQCQTLLRLPDTAQPGIPSGIVRRSSWCPMPTAPMPWCRMTRARGRLRLRWQGAAAGR